MTRSRYFVTGANRGIGLAFVKHLLSLPSTEVVVAGVRNPSKEHCAELHDMAASDAATRSKHRLHILELDVSNPYSVQACAETVSMITDGMDVLVNNAGMLIHRDTDTTNISDMVRTFETNTCGPLLVAQTLKPLLKKGRQPLVWNISSGLGSIGDNSSGGYLAYRVSKAGLNMVTKTLSLEWKDDGIAVVSVCPGYVKTDMSPDGNVAPEDTVRAQTSLWKDIDSVSEMNGKFFNRHGKLFEW
ncbi:mitochondrial SDR family oxidoreductase [Andalucia godoyi]|uniref:Mitochondrial SDR family oxidoreductase n=1 Tax=Andalucia godoyi TaxID=505711 RepID=A0A8K0F192_ANDGO|nr:mitochondrial SDR family oxidoreductase [Andalucia godoyi]|eukprot:ANDGO_05324.mRNA.1 mitochondrial SDR family oxidoreductase